MSVPERRALVEPAGAAVSVRRQCALLDLSRSGVYWVKALPAADDLALMRRIDELHLEKRLEQVVGPQGFPALKQLSLILLAYSADEATGDLLEEVRRHRRSSPSLAFPIDRHMGDIGAEGQPVD